MKNLILELITPEGKIFAGEAESVQIPGTDGSFQILLNHAPLISGVGSGTVNIKLADKSTKLFNVQGGVAEVLNNHVIILAEKIVP